MMADEQFLEEPPRSGHRFVLEVDWDDPRIIRTGPASFLYVPDLDQPAQATPAEAWPQPLPAGWTELGYTTED